MNITDLETNITDSSSKEFADEILAQLKLFREEFSTQAMSAYRQNFLDGKKEMLNEIIGYIEYVK